VNGPKKQKNQRAQQCAAGFTSDRMAIYYASALVLSSEAG
jgi:hypothetical protein